MLSGGAHAQPAYPAKLVRVIVPTVPGGSTNTLARLVAQKLSESMGQQVIVENHPGADTVIGTTLVAKAAPDGYTLLVPSATHVVIPLLTSTTYDPVRDFTPISTVAVQDFVMVVHPSVPAAIILSRPSTTLPGSLICAAPMWTTTRCSSPTCC